MVLEVGDGAAQDVGDILRSSAVQTDLCAVEKAQHDGPQRSQQFAEKSGIRISDIVGRGTLESGASGSGRRDRGACALGASYRHRD
ncbi:hypothetical protein GGF46_004703 [Coemansia sp. RSA 552]|nr:hypothetical protein GGF46_004703 [Coemansia sp. RSA 552]